MVVDAKHSEVPNRPLAGIRVIDVVNGELGAVGRHLAELGAEVLRIEPPGGSAERHQAPLIGELGVVFAAANVGKRSVELDLSSLEGALELERLLQHSDVLLHGGEQAGTLDGRAIQKEFPHLVVQTISGFGVESPIANWRISDAVCHALSGELSRSGNPGREPLLPPGKLAYACAASQATYVLLVALYEKLRSGRGDWLDFSILDGASHALDPGYGIAGSASNGVPASQQPRSRPEARFQYPILPCKDGFVRICVLASRQWQGMFKWMGSPKEFADPSFNSLKTRFECKTLIPAIARHFASKTRLELEDEGQQFGVPIASVNTLAETMASPQVGARSALVRVALPEGQEAVLPNGTLEIDGVRSATVPAVEEPGQSNQVLSQDLGPLRTKGKQATDGSSRPLSDLTVLDFGVIVVGAEQGRLLGDQGATVYKVENAAYPDGSRQSFDGSRLSIPFAVGHRNKLGLGLNLRTEGGRQVLLDLVAKSDVVLSNFKPGTLASLGLDFDTLSQVNPRIIMVDSSAFGPSGPWSKRLGYGPLVRASAGLTSMWKHADDPAGFCDAVTVYPDHTAARFGAMATIALLIRRLCTGQGGTASVAQMEVMFGQFAESIALEASPIGKGNDALPKVGGGVYPAAGDDEWIVIEIRDDRDWQTVSALIGLTDLTDVERLASAEARSEHRDEVDQRLTAWTSQRTAREAMVQLQAAGIAAGAMLRVAEVPEFEHFVSRQFLRSATHPLIKTEFLLESAPVRSLYMQDPPQGHAPLAGEHTRQILRQQLSLDDTQIDQLVEAGDAEISAP
jgi:crotonobetainyl-CoA:carnitine CoA-transferase CaiB-like acyl-CoA transferase